MIIELTQNQIAYADECCYWLVKYKWNAKKSNSKLITWYASTTIYTPEKSYQVLMHRMIMEHKLDSPLAEDELVDHINHDGLDNRCSNLRLVTAQQNNFNRRCLNKIKSSIYKGVNWDKRHEKWQAKITVDGKRIRVGLYDTQFDAAKAYDEAAKMYFGEYAKLNFLEVT